MLLLFRLFPLLLRLFNEGESSVILVDRIESKAQIHSHFCVILRPFLHFQKTLPYIRKSSFQFPVEIARDDNPDIVLLDDIKNVILLIDFREATELVSCKIHQKLYFFRVPFIIFDRKGIERGGFDS